MKDIYKSKKQLIQELEDMRQKASQVKTKKLEKESTRARADMTSEAKYRFLTEKMNDIVWTTDMNFNSTYVSPSITRILGYTPEERVVQPAKEQMTPESFERAVMLFTTELERDGREGVAPDRKMIAEIEYYHKNGSTVWMENVVSAIRDDKGKPIGLHGVSRDITKRKKAEESLQESEQKLRWMFDSIKDGILIVGPDGKVLEANVGVEKITGYSREQLLGQSGLDHMFPGFKGDALGMLQKVIARGGVQREVVVPMKTASGAVIEVEANSSALLDSSGKPVGLIGTVRDVSERKRIEEALRDSEEKLRLMFASMADGFVVTDIEGKIIDVNEAQLRMFGFKEKSELIGKGGFDFLAARERGRALADMFAVYEKGFNTGATYTVVDRNDREFECELSTALLHDAAGKPSGTVTVMRDVTERKRMEQSVRESEERYRLLAENATDLIWTMDMNLKYTYVSPSVLSLRGYTAEEAMRMSLDDTLTTDSIKTAMQVLKEEIEVDHSDQYTSRTLELELKCKDGSTVWAEVKLSFLYDANRNRIGILGITRDITERRKIREALRETNEKLQVIFDSIGEAITVVDLGGNIVDANKEALRLHGFGSKNEIIGRKASEMVAPVDRDRAVNDAIKSLKSSHSSERTECKLVDTSGREFAGEFNVAVIKDNRGKPSGFIGVARDISERKRMEEALKNSEAKLRVMFDSMMDGIVVSDTNIKIVDVNKAALELIGSAKKEELIGRNALDVIRFKDQEAAMANLMKMLQEMRPQEKVEYSVVFPNGKEMEIEVSTTMMHDNAGNLVGFVNAIRDISERKRVGEALKQSEEKYRTLAETTNDIVYSIDSMGKLTFIGPQVARYDLDHEKMVGRSMFDFIYTEDREKVLLDFERTAESGEEFPTEFRIVDDKGITHWIEEMGKLQRDSFGAIIGTTGVLRDITERRKAEEALRESEIRFRHILENSQDASYRRNLTAGRYDYLSPVITALTGYTVEEMTTMSEGVVTEHIHPDEREQVKRIFADALSGLSRTYQVEYRFMCRNGQYRWMNDLGSIMLDEAGNPQFLVGSLRDITERKQAETEIIVLSNAFKAALDAVLIFDMQGNVVNANEAAHKLFERNDTGINALEAVVPEDKEKIAMALGELLTTGRPSVAQFSIVTKSGRRVPLEASGNIILDASGKPVGIVVVERDLTERKQAEQTLKKSEEKYRNLVEREKDVIVSVDLLGFMKSANSAVKMWGYTVDEVMKMNFFDLIAPEWREVTATQLQARLLEKGEYVGETVAVRKDGEQRPIEYSAVVVYDEQGQYAGAQAIVRDISERKKSEEALQAKERYFRAITDLSSGAALVVNLEGVIVDVTGGLERLSGYTREGTIGRWAIEFIHPEEMEKAGAAFNEAMQNPGKTVTFEARLKNVRGEWQWTESVITNLLDHNDVRGIVNHLVDITERKKAEEDIKRRAKVVEALYGVAQVISQSSTLDTMLKDALGKVCAAMDTESGCIFMLDLDDNALQLKAVQGVSESAVQQFSTIALTEEGIEGIMGLSGPVTEIDETHTVADVEKAQKVTVELGRRAIAATPFFRGEDLQGLVVVFTNKERTFSGEDQNLLKAISNEMSIGINNIMLLEKTRQLSVTDELTGLYNRRYFFEMLDVEINRAGRTKHPFSLVMLDLDGFKEYNDKYGHSNGDAVLEAFSQMLKSSIRKSDLAFRYGGDEFALILPGADAGRAKKIVQRARAKWQKEPLSQSKIFGGHVGFSSGIAEYPENAESPDGLIFLADAALYQAKKKGYEDKLVSELRTLSTDIMDVATQDQVYALAATVDARDPYTYGHSQRVAEITMAIGKQIGMPAEDLDKLQAAALLHDIGKVGVPDAILSKMGKPTPEEWDVIKKHCSEGARILSYVKELSSLVPIVLHHHEWYDGSGYPSGLKGMDIPSGARITSVADAYDTMVTKRPYREEISSKEACEELKRSAGTQFDPVIVDVWCKLVEKESKKGR
ncbi:MAG: PAS domain S-box protein [Dehalococcoidia bacterium]